MEKMERLSIEDVAQIMGVERSTVVKYINTKKLIPKYRGEDGRSYFDRFAVYSLKKSIQELIQYKKRGFQMGKSAIVSSDDQSVIQEWRVQKYDRGSVDVEIGLLSREIKEISEELPRLQNDKERFLSKRNRLIRAINLRRRKLNFLKATDTERYYKALVRLGLSN